ncbi:non-ribosomal peptide synthetase, partial [Xenorhabdus lircayensis]
MSRNYNRFSEISLSVDNDDSFPFHAQPLSSPQQVIWLDQVIHPDSSNYNIGFFICIDGKLDEILFNLAFRAVVSRHDTLRLHFIQTHDFPLQAVADTHPMPVVTHDFSPHVDAEDQARQHIDTLFMLPFHLDDETLWRSELLRVSHTRCYWQFCCHHLIIDGIGLGLFLEDIVEAYNYLVRGEILNKAAPSYLDFIADDQTYLASQRYSHDLQFWLQRYKSLPPPLLPPVNPNQANNHGRAEPLFWHIDQTLFQRIEETVAQYGLSVLHLMYAVLACYFARTTDAKEIVIGIPVHNRKNTRQKRTMGMFASVIPVGVTISPEDTFLDVIHKAATELSRCYKHQRLPIAEINRQTQIQQKTGRTQLFDIALSFEPFKSNLHMEGEDTHIKFLETHHGVLYPLSVIIKQYTTGLEDDRSPVTIEFNFSTDYLSTTEVMAIQSRLAALLEGAITDLDTPIVKLPILAEAERQQILGDFNAHHVDLPQNTLIHTLFEAQAQDTPDAIAVVFEEQSLNYGELNRRANRLAHHLIALGVRPDDRVAICVERSLDMVIGLLGILKAGGAYVPLDPAYPADRLAYMLDDAAPVALLTQSTLIETLDALDCPASIVLLDTVLLDTVLPDTVVQGDVVLNNEERSVHAAITDNNPDIHTLGLTSHHLAYVIYTSGSTGQPKGVMVEHEHVTRLLAATQDRFQFNSNDIWTLFHSFAFDFSVWELWGALTYGGRLVVVSADCARSPQKFYSLLCREQVTILNQTPSAFRQLIPAQDETLHSLRCIIFGGEALELHTLVPWIARNSLQQTRLVNMYGITEITVHATYRELTEADILSGRGSLIGQPLPDLRAYLLDTQGQPVPIGVIGELHIAGAGVARGYLNRHELTTERFLPDPFSNVPGARMYKAGDLARWLPDGHLEYLGRNDFQVKLRGFRIELGEIETQLVQCHGVREAVVIARGDDADQKRLVA